jgi:acyl-CoA thioesterase I
MTATRPAAALLALAIALVPLAGKAADDASKLCSAPAELVDDTPKLPQLGANLRARLPTKIVVIGGSSTAGAAVQSPEQAYPARLQEELVRRHPGVPITVVNKGVPRQTAQEMVDRFDSDVVAEAPVLAIWETGTTDAVRGIDVEAFSSVLESGVAALRAHNIEVMLINMQYSRLTASIIGFDRYLEAMQLTSDVDDVYLFQRFEIMKYWSEADIFDYGNVPKEERAHAAATVYDCIAKRLADAIEFATQRPDP